MRNIVIGAAALTMAVLASTSGFAGNFGYATSYQRPGTYTLVRPGDLSKGTSAFIKMHANPTAAKALLASDPALAAELRAHGVQLRNIISIEKAMNGRVIVYLK